MGRRFKMGPFALPSRFVNHSHGGIYLEDEHRRIMTTIIESRFVVVKFPSWKFHRPNRLLQKIWSEFGPFPPCVWMASLSTWRTFGGITRPENWPPIQRLNSVTSTITITWFGLPESLKF